MHEIDLYGSHPGTAHANFGHVSAAISQSLARQVSLAMAATFTHQGPGNQITSANQDYGKLRTFFLTAAILVGGHSGYYEAPSTPGDVKSEPYECGIPTEGPTWIPFSRTAMRSFVFSSCMV